jgi:predicted SpoU family rRNA methylase
MKLILESIVDGISTLKDGSLKVVLSTQEVDSTTAASLFNFRNKFCKVLISDSNITSLEAELVDNTSVAVGKKPKSESSRLRAVLFRMHEQSNSELDFEMFYKNEMNKIIEHYRSKLD